MFVSIYVLKKMLHTDFDDILLYSYYKYSTQTRVRRLIYNKINQTFIRTATFNKKTDRRNLQIIVHLLQEKHKIKSVSIIFDIL